MIPEMIARIAAQFTEKAKAIGPEGDPSVLTDFIRAVAAAHAKTAFLAIHHEATRCFATEDRQALESRLEAAQVMAGCDLARCVADSLGLEEPEDRAPFEHLAAVAYEAAFRDLLKTVEPAGGVC